MISAQFYKRYYINDDIHDTRYGSTTEIFIPEYQLAVSQINNTLYVSSVTSPRTKPPIFNIIESDIDNDIKEMLEEENLNFLQMFPPSHITDIQISEENCERLKTLYQLQQNLDKAKNLLKQELHQYLSEK